MESIKFNISISDFRNIILVLCFIIFQSVKSEATHIVGGQLTYEARGKGWYDIRLVVRRDCKYGADTVFFDNPALIGVFYGDNQKAFRVGIDGVVQLDYVKNDTLVESVDKFCVGQSEEVCVHEAVYTKRVYLPFDERGYVLSYQRCCRNQTLTNIANPLETGTTYAVWILPNNLDNEDSSPQFGSFPPIYTCVNKPFLFDHSASDPDGDSLAYAFCIPYSGKSKAKPADRPDPPPYLNVVLKSPYTLMDLTNGGQGGIPFKIDPITGVISGEPGFVGQFLIGVCVLKYRKGQLIGRVIRDFELNVVRCGGKPRADFVNSSKPCDGLKQTFENKSGSADSLEWYFDFSNHPSWKSFQNNPIFTYPSAGVYEVVLVAKNEQCNDTIRKFITVIDPALKPDFILEIECNPDLIIKTFDRSNSTYPIVKYEWVMSDSAGSKFSNEKNPEFILSKDGKVTIKLTITDSLGCSSFMIKDTSVNNIKSDLIGDEVQICRGQSIRIVRNPDSTLKYTWDPVKWLDLTVPSNPLARPDSTIRYNVTITNGLCTLNRSILVIVKDSIKFKIVGDTSTCTGKIKLMAMSDSTDYFEWSLNINFPVPVDTGSMFMINLLQDTTVYVRAGKKEGCQSMKSIRLYDHSARISFDKEHELCAGDTLKINLRSLDSTDRFTVVWFPDSFLISGQSTMNACFVFPKAGKYVIYFKATNQYNCMYSDSVTVNIVEPPEVEFEVDTICGSLKVKVRTNARGKIKWDFGDGKGMAFTPVAEYMYMNSGKYTITLYVDSVCLRSSSKMVNVFLIKPIEFIKPPCYNDCIFLNPNGDHTLNYMWWPEDCLDNPNIPNPLACCPGLDNKTFYVKITHPDFPDCPFFDTLTVDWHPNYFIEKWLKLPEDTTLCAPGKAKFTVVDSFGILDTVIWCDLNGNVIGRGPMIELEVDTNTCVIYKLDDINGCVFKDTVCAFLYELKVEILGPSELCLGDTIMLLLDTLLPDGYTYKWTPAKWIIGVDTLPKITVAPQENIVYTLTIDNGKGCSWSFDHEVKVSQLKSSIFAMADPSMIVPGYKTQLTTVMGSGYTYRWAPDDGSLSALDIYNPLAMPMQTTTYTVTVIDEFGCQDSASVTVMVKTCEEAVFLPNAFSPNGDGKNDFFLPRSDFLTKINLVIYSRWGEKVFETNELTPGWDGSFKGEKLSPDVFGYYLRYFCFENREFSRKGNVNLIK